MSLRVSAALLMLTAGCAQVDRATAPPKLTPVEDTLEHQAMIRPPLLLPKAPAEATSDASLWSSGRESLLGDRRARDRGDILTVVIEIDESGEIFSEYDRDRSASQNLAIPELFGVPQILERPLPGGSNLGNAVDLSSAAGSSGQGSVRRDEELLLRVAATVIDVLDTGALRIQGTQQVRVNNELRELLVTGYVRPEDVSRRNEVTYDKLAAARISYGGRGIISTVQTPRYGQAIADEVLPF